MRAQKQSDDHVSYAPPSSVSATVFLYHRYLIDDNSDTIKFRRFPDIGSMSQISIVQAEIDRHVDDAHEIGYSKMRLDTYPPKMGKAVKLYESHGFRPITPYYDNPHTGVLFMEKTL